jgi:GntR family transcriptional regulator
MVYQFFPNGRFNPFRSFVTGLHSNPNALPKYVQISELLIRDSAAGRLMDGERLAPERVMAEGLATSEGNLRKALAILEQKGMFDRLQGSGNYILHGVDGASVYGMFRLELPEGGGLPQADVVDAQSSAKPDDLPEFGTSDHGTRIRHLRYLNEIIIVIEGIWVAGDAGEVPPNALSDSLYHFYQNIWGSGVHAEDRVSVAGVPAWPPDSFTKPTGVLTGYIEHFSWADKPEAVEFSRTWFDATRAVYVQRLKYEDGHDQAYQLGHHWLRHDGTRTPTQYCVGGGHEYCRNF